MPSISWSPIEPLADQDRQADLATMRPLYESWRDYKTRLSEQDAAQLEDFNKRLIRRLSIETGILEKLYDLDRGTTEALVAQGFVEDLVSRSSGSIDPGRIVDYLNDQEAAIKLVVDCVAQKRSLTKGVIHELHQILTAHQDTREAIDALGRRVDVPLRKGQYKLQPNNPRRPDGEVHEYCPPLHVDSEMDNLLLWFKNLDAEDPIVVAAWLHHRFAQIHPYEDGNGRLSRVLVTYVLLRANLLPLVIDRDQRPEYIADLEKADGGDLSSLIQAFARLERTAILQALSVSEDVTKGKEHALSSAVIESIGDRLIKRQQAKFTELRTVNQLAKRLRHHAKQELDEIFENLSRAMPKSAAEHFTIEGGSDYATGHWYKYQIGKTAKKVGRFANFTEDHYFTKSKFNVGSDRLHFVVSFHHAGRELTGVMEATAFAILESSDKADEDNENRDDVLICSQDPFILTYKTDFDSVKASFAKWLDAASAMALKEFGDAL